MEHVQYKKMPGNRHIIELRSETNIYKGYFTCSKILLRASFQNLQNLNGMSRKGGCGLSAKSQKELGSNPMSDMYQLFGPGKDITGLNFIICKN